MLQAHSPLAACLGERNQTCSDLVYIPAAPDQAGVVETLLFSLKDSDTPHMLGSGRCSGLGLNQAG